jgi:uncharacterized surface protein with fasciclin (FAS1) repeats
MLLTVTLLPPIANITFSVFAQTITGSIRGRVTDQLGRVVQNATVTLTSKATGNVRKVAAGPDGAYVIDNLVPGEYAVRIGAEGFATQTISLLVQTGSTTSGDAALRAGAKGEVVDVVADVEAMFTDIVTNIAEANASNADFSRFILLLKSAGLEKLLEGNGPFTVFMPRDHAFDRMPIGTLNGLLSDGKRLKSVVGHLIIERRVLVVDRKKTLSFLKRYPSRFKFKTTAVTNLKSAKTEGERVIAASDKDSFYMLNGARIDHGDILCRNGVIHIIDSFLIDRK